MNVIISQDKSVRFTQESSSAYNIQDISFYISKEIEVEDAVLQLKSLRSVYPFLLAQTGESKNYNIYKVYFTQAVNLSAKEYEMSVLLNYEEIDIGTHALQAIKVAAPMMMLSLTEDVAAATGISDQHDPIEIVDRDIIISGNKNVIVAEDNVSQEIRFRLAKFYDNVDLSTKSFYFDYLKTVEEYGIKETKLFNEPLVVKPGDPVQNADGSEEEMLILHLIVPYDMTENAGALSFAISAIDDVPDTATGYQYIWQTKPSSLVIQKNLHKRNATPVQGESSTGAEELQNQIDALKTTNDEQTAVLNTILESDIYSIDTDSTDSEVVIGGGGAPEEA